MSDEISRILSQQRTGEVVVDRWLEVSGRIEVLERRLTTLERYAMDVENALLTRVETLEAKACLTGSDDDRDLGPQCDDVECPDPDPDAGAIGLAILTERERMRSSMCLQVCTALGAKGMGWYRCMEMVREFAGSSAAHDETIELLRDTNAKRNALQEDLAKTQFHIVSLTRERDEALRRLGIECKENDRSGKGLADLKASVDSERARRQTDIKADIQARAVLIRDRDEAVKRHADLLAEFDVVLKQRDEALACVEAAEMGMQEALASIGSWRRS